MDFSSIMIMVLRPHNQSVGIYCKTLIFSILTDQRILDAPKRLTESTFSGNVNYTLGLLPFRGFDKLPTILVASV